MKTKICIAGKNNIAVNITQYILKTYRDIDIVALFNKNDNGQNSFQRSFKNFCHNNDITETNLEDLYHEENLIFLSLEFDKIIKPELFSTNELFNIHFSLLPEYKGMFTSALPILHGKNYTGVTLHKIERGIDTGDIIEQVKFEISDQLKSEELYHLYIAHATELIIKNIDSLLNKKYKTYLQNSTGSTYFSTATIDYSNIRIDLNKTAYEIQRQINAYVFPAYQLPTVKEYKIYNTEMLPEKSILKNGTLINDEYFYIDLSSIDFNIRLYKDLREKLFEAAKNGDIDLIKYFIATNYDIHQRSPEGWDIAIIAAYNDQFDLLDYLITNLAWDVNSVNYNGTTLVMYLMTRASQNSDSSYFQKFINNNDINLQITDYSLKDIWYYSNVYGNTEVINLLLNYK